MTKMAFLQLSMPIIVISIANWQDTCYTRNGDAMTYVYISYID